MDQVRNRTQNGNHRTDVRRIDDFVEQLMQRDEVPRFDVPMRLFGLMHQINCVGEPRVQNGNNVSALLRWKIVLRFMRRDCV